MYAELSAYCASCQPACRRTKQGLQHRTIGDEKHLVFECPALQDLRDKRPHLFDGAQTDAMVLFSRVISLHLLMAPAQIELCILKSLALFDDHGRADVQHL